VDVVFTPSVAFEVGHRATASCCSDHIELSSVTTITLMPVRCGLVLRVAYGVGKLICRNWDWQVNPKWKAQSLAIGVQEIADTLGRQRRGSVGVALSNNKGRTPVSVGQAVGVVDWSRLWM